MHANQGDYFVDLKGVYMVDMGSNPLVSIVLTTFNRRLYVRDAIASVFAQTYEPLEIIISDDHSTDGTWEIVQEEVKKFHGKDDLSRPVILNRNEQNLGLLRHFEKCAALCHGELLVEFGDDDVSLPNRVEETVRAWIEGGKKAKLIHCQPQTIDANGRVRRRKFYQIDAFSPLGAVAAYSIDVFREFPPVLEDNAYEDRPYAGRAAILMACECSSSVRELYLQQRLVLYRTGQGMSTSLRNYRYSAVKSLGRSLAGCRQNLIDLEDKRDVLGENYLLR